MARVTGDSEFAALVGKSLRRASPVWTRPFPRLVLLTKSKIRHYADVWGVYDGCHSDQVVWFRDGLSAGAWTRAAKDKSASLRSKRCGVQLRAGYGPWLRSTKPGPVVCTREAAGLITATNP